MIKELSETWQERIPADVDRNIPNKMIYYLHIKVFIKFGGDDEIF